MKAITTIIREIFSLIIITVLAIILVLSPILISLSNYVTSRETFFHIFNDSGVYKEASNIAYDSIVKSLKEDGISIKEIPVKNFDKVIKNLVSESFVKTNAESIVNGIFDFLEEKTPNLTISTEGLDLTKAIKDSLPKEVVNNIDIIKQFETLKPCTQAQAEKYEKLGGFTSIKDVCLPPTLNITDVIDSGYDKNIDIKTIQIDDIFGIPQIQQTTAEHILSYYKIIKSLPIILLSITIILSILFILIDPSTNFKYYTLSLTYILAGGINFILFKGEIVTKYINTLLEKTFSAQKDILISSDIITNITNIIMSDVFKQVSTYGLYILLGGIGLFGLYLLFSKIFPKRVSN